VLPISVNVADLGVHLEGWVGCTEEWLGRCHGSFRSLTQLLCPIKPWTSKQTFFFLYHLRRWRLSSVHRGLILCRG
jgi:hypothetical protein